jgi:hypothetical protein
MVEKIAAAEPDLRTVSVHADESGKGQRFLVVASVWSVDISQEWRIPLALQAWCREHQVKKEFKFTDLTGQKITAAAKGFVQRAMEFSNIISLKACVLDTSKAKGWSLEEALFRLYYELAISGMKHEVDRGRVTWPSFDRQLEP